MSEEKKVKTGKGLGIAGMILGILGLLSSFNPCLFMWALLLCIVGLILSGVSISQAKKSSSPKGMAVTGLVTAIIGIIVVLLWGFVFGGGAVAGASALGAAADQLNDPAFQEAIKEGLENAAEQAEQLEEIE